VTAAGAGEAGEAGEAAEVGLGSMNTALASGFVYDL
jgi:hypothetical protein